MSRKIAFLPLDGYGHVNSCVGIAEQLQQSGHAVTFILEQAWANQMTKKGFGEELYTDPSREPGLGPNEFWMRSMDMILDTMHMNSIEKAQYQNKQEFEEFIMGAFNYDSQIADALDRIQPDVIVVDQYVTIPAVVNSKYKWIQMTSATPLAVLSHPDLPPSGSGYPTDGDRAQWKRYDEVFIENHIDILNRYFAKQKEFGVHNIPDNSLFVPSPYLNFYAYPRELDYFNIRPLPPKWISFDHFVRTSDTMMSGSSEFKLPEHFAQLPGKLIYISMGSMGVRDHNLIGRFVDILKDIPHRFLLVMGTNFGKFQLPINVHGARYFPQIQILPMIDLFITHGGNNSVIEGLLNGKRLIVNPLFADQYDNAQRLSETGYGYRINAYTISATDLEGVINEALANEDLGRKLEQISRRLKQSNSTRDAAKAILQVADGISFD